MQTEKRRWIQMRNPEGIRTEGQVHWRPLAHDNRLWIDPTAFNHHLQDIRFPYPLDIISVSSKKEEPPQSTSLPDEAGTAVMTETKTDEKKDRKPHSWATLDPDGEKGLLYVDSTLLANEVERLLRVKVTDERFASTYGQKIDEEVRRQLRVLIIHRYYQLLSQKKDLSKEFQTDVLATLVAVIIETILVCALGIIEIVKALNGSFESVEFLTNIALLVPSFFLFYATAYVSLAPLFDLIDVEFDSSDTEAERRSKLKKQYLKNLFTLNNIPRTLPMPDLSVPLIRSYLHKKPLIKGSAKMPTGQ